MQTVTFRDLVYAVADLVGISPDEDGAAEFGDVLSTDLMPITRALDALLREGWRHYPFPDLLEIVECAYRELWTSTATYVSGDEVYFNTVEGSEGYFEANQSVSAAQSPVTHPAKWDALEIERLVIDPAEWTLGNVLNIYASDPRDADTERAASLGFVIRSDGIQVQSGAGETVWVEHLPVPPRLRGAAWDSTAIYSAGDPVLFENENFWVALDTTAAGESPTTNPELWELQEVPMVFRDYLVQRAHATMLRRDGAHDQAMAQDELGWQALWRERDHVEGQQGQVKRYRVGNTR